MKRPKKIQGDQLEIDELLPDAPAIAHKPARKAFKKRALYRASKQCPSSIGSHRPIAKAD